MHKPIIAIHRNDLRALYKNFDIFAIQNLLSDFTLLKSVFVRAFALEQRLNPISDSDLIHRFIACGDGSQSPQAILDILHFLAPGNGRVGMRQIEKLVDYLRQHVSSVLHSNRSTPTQLPCHVNAFGAGGDLVKTLHATTMSTIVAAPLVTICKIGTVNVTSMHGSQHVINKIGYPLDLTIDEHLIEMVKHFGFAFIPLATLGIQFADSRRIASKKMWDQAVAEVYKTATPSDANWQEAVQALDIPLDIFKIVVPNSQPLNPTHHVTAVCHLKMLPYVLGVFLYLGTNGMILHSLDGIDEISNASSNPDPAVPNNLVVKVESDRILIEEFGPEDIGLRRVPLREIEDELLADEADLFWRILRGEERGPKRDFVVANAAALLVAADKIPNAGSVTMQLRQAVKLVEQLVDSGESHRNFQALLAYLNERANKTVHEVV